LAREVFGEIQVNKKMLRSTVAIALGSIITAGGYILTIIAFALFNQETFTPGVPLPSGWLLVTLVVSAIWSTVAAFVTGVIARRREIEHAIGLALLSLMISAYFVSRNRNLGQVPTWYVVSGEVLTCFSLLVGGWLRKSQRILLGKVFEGVVGRVDDARLSIAIGVDRWRFLIAAVVTFITFLAFFWALVLGAGQGLLW
jgi:hypothetical protein